MFFRTAKGTFLSLRARLAFYTIVAVAVALVVAFFWARRNLYTVLLEQIDETLVNKSLELDAVAVGSFEALDLELHREIEVYEKVEMTVRIDVDDGRVLIAPDDRDGRRLAAKLKDAPEDRRLRTVDSDGQLPALRVFTGRIAFPRGGAARMTIAVSLDRAFETLRLFDRRVLLGGATLLVIAVPIGLWLYRLALRPVSLAVQEARQLDPHDLTARLPVAGTGDELDQLSQVINELLSKVERRQEQVARFTADASHQLRTPLAAMKASIDVALQRPRDAEEYRASLDSLGTQCEKLTAIVEKLQWLARADAGKLQSKSEVVDVGRIVREAVEFLAPLAEEKGVVLEATTPSSAKVVGDAGLLRQVFVNLVDNAVKFTPTGGRVDAVVEQNGYVVVSVSDTGAGIPEADSGQVFERFYRAGGAHAMPGSGLGLSICKSIVEMHGGDINARRRPGGGSVFNVRLLKAESPK